MGWGIYLYKVWVIGTGGGMLCRIILRSCRVTSLLLTIRLWHPATSFLGHRLRRVGLNLADRERLGDVFAHLLGRQISSERRCSRLGLAVDETERAAQLADSGAQSRSVGGGSGTWEEERFGDVLGGFPLRDGLVDDGAA